MAYSGTTNQTKINVDQLISYAYRDAGKLAEEITPEYISAGKQALFYILQNLSNRGVNLWLLENNLIGAQTAQQSISMPNGTIDIREANWVYLINPSLSASLPTDNPDSEIVTDQALDLQDYGTSTTLKNYFGASYAEQTRVFYAGFNAYAPSGSVTYNFVLEASNDGTNWELIETLPTVTLADKQWYYAPINKTQAYYYWRFRETVATTFSVRYVGFYQSQQIIPLSRLNRDDYWSLPNKQFPSQRSLQYWFDRTIDPSMYVWPVPNNNFQMFQLLLEREMPDVGSLTNELYVPNRWIAYIQSALSHKLGMQLPGIDINRVVYLEKLALDLRTQAEEEDRDKSPIYFQPNISYYTR